MSATDQRSIEPAGFFVLRTPLLPFDELAAWGDGMRATSAPAAELEAALAADVASARGRLRAIVERPAVREALFVASPSLDASLAAWLEAPDSERGRKVENTLVRYVTRMASRPTPFGLFAACTVGTIGDATRLTTQGLDGYRRHARLDVDYLCALCEAIVRQPMARRALVYRPNASIHRLAGRLHYVEARLDGRRRSYHLTAATPTDYLDATLARARQGARLEELAAALVGDDISREEADAYLDELVDSQLLVTDLAPLVTGPEPVHDLVAQLSTAPATRSMGQTLDDVRRALAALDAEPLGAPPGRYRQIAATMETLPAELELGRLFQVDMVKPGDATSLGPQPLAEIVRGIEILRRLPRARVDELAPFRDAFVRRYQNRVVPLIEALDDEAGVGFGASTGLGGETAPLLEGLPFAPKPTEPTAPVDAQAELLFAKLGDALRNGAHEIVLDEAELRGLAPTELPPLADSIAAMVTLAASSPEAIARGEFTLLFHGAAGPSGANLLGRFCHGDDRLLALVRAYLRHEEAQRPDAIFAEVVHLPEGRVGNVLLRPLLRDHEISFLGRSGAPPEQQILVEDLLVSVERTRVVLRSRRLGREVLPRLTTAHAFSSPRNLGLYRFLCAVAQQGASRLSFGWGALEAAPFLPRVRVGRLLLSLARWRLDAATLKRLGAVKGAARFAAVQALRQQHGWPRWVAVADGDHLLPIDLDNPLSVETFVHLVKERALVTLTELFAPEQQVARGPEGGFVHELIVPLSVDGPRPGHASASSPAPTLTRLHPPGSDWLYIKLYCGAVTADHVLRDAIAPMLRVARAAGTVDDWFFIRYGDPDLHLRLRFRGEAARLHGELLPQIEELAMQLLAGQQIWKMVIDSYDRELERYGGDAGMQLSEQLFAADSDCALAILDGLDGDAGEDARWRLCLRGMDLLLDDLRFDLAARHALVEERRAAFGAELAVGASMERALGEKFRRERLALERLFDGSGDDASPLASGLAALRARSTRLRPIAAALRQRSAAGELGATVEELAASYLHMHANRLLRSAARAQELVLYDLLERLYRGRLVRQRSR